MRRSCVWQGMEFQLLPGASWVMPMHSWQLCMTAGWIYWLMTRLLQVSTLPSGRLLALSMSILTVG